jgi:endonuclease I/V8-like Glu-specific endopeptidase
MKFNLDIARHAAERWEQHGHERGQKEEKIRSGNAVEAESPKRIQARLERLQMNVVREQMRVAEVVTVTGGISQTPLSSSSLVGQLGFERILGRPDFLNVNFLELALAFSRFVGRINIKLNRTQSVGFGTGFMVSPRLLLTNNHVLPTKQEAIFSEVEFDYQYDRFGRLLPVVNYGLEPQTFFITNYELDFTLVAVSNKSVDNKVELKTYGWNRLIKAEGKALIGDSLNIIQHPRGEAKQIALRSNRLLDLLDEGFAHYEADTEPGSSGSPVYNDQWEVVALHHSGVPKKENGQFIDVDGNIWHEGDDPERLAWVANEGIRISRIVDYIEKQNLSGEQASLRRELLEDEPPNPVVAAIQAEKDAEQNRPAPLSAPAHQPINNLQALGGSVSFTIPLHITVQIGTPESKPTDLTVGSGQNSSDYPPSPVKGGIANSNNANTSSMALSEPIDSPELREALAEFETARNKPYYDAETDKTARDRYYRNIHSDQLNKQDLFNALNELLEKTHHNQINYKPATHVYPWIDLQESGLQLRLKSIYSGREFNAQDFIEADFRIEQERAKIRELLIRESSFNAMETERQLNLLEASMPYNCEHVVPQSWFNKKEPMRGDIHHLFACEVGCNSFRSNIPYFDFPDFEETTREACGKREENKFEPSAGKGAVARATLYFLLRYPSEINRTAKEYTEDRLQTILKWHRNNPVSRYEKHRNAAIYEKQGNRNPLIDFPEWIDLIDFTRGLG